MKVMIYSQHVLGIGHFFRSMEIAKSLHKHLVLFVEGGDPVSGFLPPEHVTRVFLPSLMMDAGFKTMEARGGALEETKKTRADLLTETFQAFEPDVLVTELFPFGRKQFRSELMPLLNAIREGHHPTRIVCSLRDILVEKGNQTSYENGVLAILNDYYHLLLVHSDPDLIRLDETFGSVNRIRIPIHYTGFVVRKAPKMQRFRAGRTIVASSGGGKVGVDLLTSTIRAFHTLHRQDLGLKVFLGPFMEPDGQRDVEELASADSRISVHPFALDFLSELATADLSISMAGYNTCMDILSVGLKALVYPFAQNREQALRARKLERLGILRVLDSLEASTLARRILEELEGGGTQQANLPDLAGAEATACWLEHYFDR